MRNILFCVCILYYSYKLHTNFDNIHVNTKFQLDPRFEYDKLQGLVQEQTDQPMGDQQKWVFQ